MIESNPIIDAKKFFLDHLTKGKILPFSEIQFNVEDSEYALYHQLLKKWYQAINELTFLPEDLDNIEEIFIHGPSLIIVKTKDSRYELDTDITHEDLNIICDLLIQKNNLSWNYQEPFISFHHMLNKHNTRISMVHYSSSPNNQSKLFIRILKEDFIPIESYSGSNSFFKKIIHDKKNILIAGATGSGKTTFANSLLKLIPGGEHIIIIEDTKELISPNEFTTRMITDRKNENKSMNSYLSYALRMSPDRVILGEIRSQEAESSLLSMNTGNNGFISTIHANSAKDAIHRLSLLFKIYSSKSLSFELVLKLITTNIDYVVFIKEKDVFEIIDVFGSDKDNIFFETLGF